jgi:hypothetical protein
VTIAHAYGEKTLMRRPNVIPARLAPASFRRCRSGTVVAPMLTSVNVARFLPFFRDETAEDYSSPKTLGFGEFTWSHTVTPASAGVQEC